MKHLQRLILNGAPADPAQARWEFLSAVALWASMMLLVCAVVTGRAAGAALFLNQYGGRELALVYVLVGLAVVPVVYGLSWVTHGIRYERVAVVTIAALGVGTTVFRLLIPCGGRAVHPWLFAALYVFLETFAVVSTVQVWTLANSLFNAAQARRLYVFIATGGILGSVLGGAGIRLLGFLRTVDLLWVVVGLCPLVITGLTVFNRQAHRLRRVVVKEPLIALALAASPRGDQMIPWIRHPVLRRRPVFRIVSKLALLTFLGAFTTNLIDFYFKTYADQQFAGNAAELARFFGNFYLLVGGVSLVMQLVVTPAIVRHSVVFTGLALMPAVLSLCTTVNLLGATLVRATLLKLFDSGFAHSVYRSCTEMLYNPLPPDLTGEVKLISEGVAGRAGVVMAGLMLFLLAPVLTTGRTLGLISLLLVCWLAALGLLKRTYGVVESQQRTTQRSAGRLAA
jgi:AAA family ATP:ADP antiporter